MAKTYTGVYADTLTIDQFDDSAYDGIAIIKDVPVSLSYRVLPGNEVAFGAGTNSLNGVRTAYVMQIKPMDSANTPAAVPCKYRLVYEDPNKVRATVVRQALTANVSGDPTSENQFNYLPETTNMRVPAYSYLTIQLTPLATAAGKTFVTANSTIQLPVTTYTLINATGV